MYNTDLSGNSISQYLVPDAVASVTPAKPETVEQVIKRDGPSLWLTSNAGGKHLVRVLVKYETYNMEVPVGDFPSLKRAVTEAITEKTKVSLRSDAEAVQGVYAFVELSGGRNDAECVFIYVGGKGDVQTMKAMGRGWAQYNYENVRDQW